MLNRQPPNTYFHPEAGSSFPTNRYGFLLFCLHSTYEDLERNKESMQTLKDFLNAAKAWVKNLPLDVGKKLKFYVIYRYIFLCNSYFIGYTYLEHLLND